MLRIRRSWLLQRTNVFRRHRASPVLGAKQDYIPEQNAGTRPRSPVNRCLLCYDSFLAIISHDRASTRPPGPRSPFSSRTYPARARPTRADCSVRRGAHREWGNEPDLGDVCAPPRGRRIRIRCGARRQPGERLPHARRRLAHSSPNAGGAVDRATQPRFVPCQRATTRLISRRSIRNGSFGRSTGMASDTCSSAPWLHASTDFPE